jgi:hypothetical protein
MFAGIRWNPYCGGRRTGYLNSMGMDSSSLIMLILPAPEYIFVISQVWGKHFAEPGDPKYAPPITKGETPVRFLICSQ